MSARIRLTAIGVGLALVAAASLARAAVVTWHVSGHVVAIEDDFGESDPAKTAQLGTLGVVPGAAVTGSISIDTATADYAALDPTSGVYQGALTHVALEIATVRIGLPPGGAPPAARTLAVTTNDSPGGAALLLSAPGRDDPPIAALGVFVILDQYAGTLSFPTDALPATPPTADQAESVDFMVGSTGEFVIRLALDALTGVEPEPVPALGAGAQLPLALALLSCAALAACAAQTGRMPRFFGGSGSSGRAR